MHLFPPRPWSLLLLTVIATGCRSSGSLSIDVEGLPEPLVALVDVTGPDGFAEAVSDSTTLEDLALGSYIVTADPVTDDLATYTATVSGSPVEVARGSTAVATVDYRVVTGTLQVDVLGVTPGTAANVIVSGPGDFEQRLTQSAMIEDLVPGEYLVSTPAQVRTDDPVVSTLFDRAGPGDAPVTLASGSTEIVTVTFAMRSGTGLLWVPELGERLLGWTSLQLTEPGTATPRILTFPDGVNQQAVAFDGDGNAWVSDYILSTVSKHPPGSLMATGTPTPTVLLEEVTGPVGIAFDDQGNLWVTQSNNQLRRLAPTDRLASGTPAEGVVIHGDGSSLNLPVGIAFDASGDLWVTSLLSSKVEKFTPAQLASSGAPTPAVTLTLGAGRFPRGLAFDAAGNLWVSTTAPSELIRFTPSQRVTSGTPVPTVRITANGDSLAQPRGMAFDASGSLWVTNRDTGNVVMFTAGQLATSASPVPAFVLEGVAIVDEGGLAFNPPPENSTIRLP